MDYLFYFWSQSCEVGIIFIPILWKRNLRLGEVVAPSGAVVAELKVKLSSITTMLTAEFSLSQTLKIKMFLVYLVLCLAESVNRQVWHKHFYQPELHTASVPLAYWSNVSSRPSRQDSCPDHVTHFQVPKAAGFQEKQIPLALGTGDGSMSSDLNS